MSYSLQKCTKENPYTPERDKDNPDSCWAHDSAREVGEQQDGWPCGDTVLMCCSNCGVEWVRELPQ